MKKINFEKQLKKSPFVLAPMDDVTDIAFRELCEERGASYSTTELTSIDALVRDKVYKSRYERGNLKINSVQLFGSKPDVFVEAAKIVSGDADIIDVNFGCPSPAVTRNDGGSALLKDPKNVSIIISKLVKHIDKPITAKIRLGYTKMDHLSIAKEIEDAGASLIAVHGRTAKQKYTGAANWDAIKEVYDALKIPVVGNGDVKSEEDIEKYLNKSSGGLMVGRAAIGNPFIFERFQYYYEKGKKLRWGMGEEGWEIEDERQSEKEQKLEFIKKQMKEKQKELFKLYLKKLEGKEFYALNVKISRQAMWFMKGIEGTRELRTKIAQEKDIEKVLQFVEEF